MKYPLAAFAFFLIFLVVAEPSHAQGKKHEVRFGFVVHGGAGTIERGKMTPEREKQYRAGLELA
jgi:beta-aspartyl-peptidase (threonine type)